MELDSRMTINGGSNGPDWNKPDADTCMECGKNGPVAEVNGRDLCQKCDDKQAVERQLATWTDELKAVKPGDVVIAVNREGWKTVLSVQINYENGSIWGDSMQINKDGQLVSVNAGIGTIGTLGSYADLHVVSL